MPSRRIKDLPAGSATEGHFLAVDPPSGSTYRIPLGQGGGVPMLNATGVLARTDGYMFRGTIYMNGVDWNTLTQTGFYRVYAGGTGGANQPPAGYHYGMLIVTADGGSGIVQVYVPHAFDNGIYIRELFDSWSPWRAFGLHSAGSNSNGQFWRYANGLQICTHQVPNGSPAAFTWTFPAAFAIAPVVTASIATVGAATLINVTTLPSTTSVSLRKLYWTGSGWADATDWAGLIAIGVWR